MKRGVILLIFAAGIIFLANPILVSAQKLKANPELDKKVQAFLDRNRNNWHDLNVPEVDGKLLYHIVLVNGYTKTLETGTSTGHSSIRIAWALSKTGPPFDD